MKKRVFTAILGCMAFCLSACGNSEEKKVTSSSKSSAINTTSSANENQKKEKVTETSTPKVTKKKIKKIISNNKVKSYGGTVVVGDSGYEIYNYIGRFAKTYTTVINGMAGKMSKQAKVYDMIVPTSVGITFPDNLKNKIGSSNQNKSIQQMNDMLSKDVTTISLYDEMMKHRTEYIYFRTDHHWTARGAYYAYGKYCEEAGLQAHGLKEYQSVKYPGFKGSFYAETKNDKNLKPDTMEAYLPLSKKASLTYTNEDGQEVKGHIIENASKYGASLKYSAFIDGDNPLTVIENKSCSDKSNILVVKESFGNAFVPFLTDHYSKVYVIDYRYWNGKLQDFVKKNKVQNVLFLNNISMTRNAYLLGKLAQIGEK